MSQRSREKGYLRWIGWVKFDLVHCRNDFAGGVVEQFLEMTDLEVGHADVPDLASVEQLLHFLPGAHISARTLERFATI